MPHRRLKRRWPRDHASAAIDHTGSGNREMAMRASYSGSSASESSGCCQQQQQVEQRHRRSIRTVKLVRRSHPPARLGFSIRGGCEHGTGFFITSVEPGSEAHVQGLVVGDQIIRVNGYPVDDATHQEVLQLIQRQNVVTLKVKAVGMIPVKDNPDDELTWRIVEPEIVANTELIRPDLIEDHPALRSPSDVKMVLKVPPKAKLGCGICKGPEWKPGVFVQFTKENSIARTAGLRPGDQIVQCNNFTFTPETPFNEAVSVLRCSGILELVVRKGAGVDLFPGESSGYNSSASSVAGDNPWPNRLSSVAEESSGHSRNENKINSVNGFEQNGRLQNGVHNVRTDYTNGCTVIRVGGDECDNKSKLAEICMVSQQLETKTTTVLVEVHHSEEDDVSHTNSDSSTDRLTNSSSVSSFTSSACSLSSAISQELARRSKRASAGSSPPQPTDKLVKSGLAKEKVQQHEQLMQEFKKAHRKMFSTSEIEKDTASAVEEREEQKQMEQKRMDRGEGKAHVELNGKGKEESEKLCPKKQPAPPPPPPPFPVEESSPAAVPNMSAPVQPPPQKKYPAPPPPSPPHCPTPDYDDTTAAVSSQKPASSTAQRNGKGDTVEMQSLESFKLTHPEVTKPRPPNTYFARKINGTETTNGSQATLPMKDPSKPVVTIREYPGTKERRSPAKFDFLQNGTETNGDGTKQPITSRFQSELTQTLSRANLQAKSEPIVTETVQNGHSKGTVVTISVSSEQKKPETPKPFYLFSNDNQTLNGATDKNKNAKTFVNLCKAINEKPKLQPIDSYNKNSVTFNFGNKNKEKKNVAIIHPNGILKNGTNM